MPLVTSGLRHPGEGDVRVSVILPVYNPGPGIRTCIQSLRSQLLDGLELIFVDDCSTDDSMAEVEAWAAADPRVRILRNGENLGAGPSRNRGIEVARGDYLSFIDPNDYPSASFFLLLYAAATAEGEHDMAKGTCEVVNADGTWSRASSELVNDRIRSAARGRTPLFTAFTSEQQTAIYRHSLFGKGACYGTSSEDADVTFLLSACLVSEDIVLNGNAICHRSSKAEPSGESRQLCFRAGESDSIIEKVALLWERPRDMYAKRYLEARLAELITSHYAVFCDDPPPFGALNDYAQDIADMVACLTTLGFLANKNPYHGALVEHRMLLPLADSLPDGLKAKVSHD